MKTPQRQCLLAITCAFLAFSCASRSARPGALPNSLESEIQEILDSGVTAGIPGISAAIATSYGIVWTGVAGNSDLETKATLRPDMLFGIGSITKTFVAVVILQLVEEKRLDLNVTPASLLGTAVQNIPNADKATLAQLLNHTSGVPSWEEEPAWIRDGRGDRLNINRTWGKTDTLGYIAGHTPLGEPGEKFSYANTNFTLLGMVIEKVTGEDVVRAIHRRILEPIGLKDIYMEGFESEPQSRLPHRYHWATADFQKTAGVNKAFREVRPGLIDASLSNLSVEWTAGAMVATARDLALYGVALRDGRLLSSESMRFMEDWFPADEGEQIGHNLFRHQYPDGVATIGHTGGVLGFSAALQWVEGTDAVMTAMCNVGKVHSGVIPESAQCVGTKRQFIDAAMRLALSK